LGGRYATGASIRKPRSGDERDTRRSFLNVKTDPEFHALALAQFRAMRAETRRLLDEAVAARGLFTRDTEEVGRLLQELNDEAMLGWAVFREGTLEGWVRREVEGCYGLTGGNPPILGA
jgi:hypothetical protein